MTDTDLLTTPVDSDRASDSAPQASGDAAQPAAKREKGLTTMLLPELRTLATQLGIKGISAMRKGDLIAAIKTRQSGGGEQPTQTALLEPSDTDTGRGRGRGGRGAGAATETAAQPAETAQPERRPERQGTEPSGETRTREARDTQQTEERHDERTGDRNGAADRGQGERRRDRGQGDRAQGDRGQGDRGQGDRAQGDRAQGDRAQGDRRTG